MLLTNLYGVFKAWAIAHAFVLLLTILLKCVIVYVRKILKRVIKMKTITKSVIRFICLTLCAVLMLLSVIGCDGGIASNKYGNSYSNLSNSAIAAKQGNWIYYATKKGVYKVKDNGQDAQMLYQGNCNNISVVGKWVYFREYGSLDFYRMKTNGNNKEVFLSDVEKLCIANDWVYYTRLDDGALYKTKLSDTSKPVCIINDLVKNRFDVVDDKIFWVNNGNIKEFDLDGKLLNEYEGTNSLLEEDGYYYSVAPAQSDGYGIQKSKIDGSESVRLALQRPVDELAIYDGWLYYTTKDSKHNICRIKTDGTNDEILNNEYSTQISIVGDWIYYKLGTKDNTSGNYVFSYYRMHLDGSENQQIEE